MRNMDSKDRVKDWARTALRVGLLLTEPQSRAAMGEQLRDGARSVKDTVSNEYDGAVDRFHSLDDDQDNVWPSRIAGFCIGVGVGAGLGLLLAPATGSETRDAIRDRAVDVKNRVVDTAASAAGRVRNSVTSMASTGTVG